MRVTERAPGDIDELRRLAAGERDAMRRDRYRAVVLALGGGEAAGIAAALGRGRRNVQKWVYAYRDGGVAAVQPPRRKGRTPKLPRESEPAFKARLDAGAVPGDGVCTLRGADVVAVLEREFGAKYTLGGAYDLLDRLGYSCLRPRPKHEKADPAAAEAFKASAPLLSPP